MNQKPLLSIGMIVKNEIRCLEKCLKALQPLRDAVPCELVIADTGSTDGTREIAEKYADILFDFEWINDFAAARNAVLERCSGEWYLTVDADEYLRPNIDEMVMFLTHPEERPLATFGTVIIRNYSTVDMRGEYDDFAALRFARRTDSLHYSGTIHEVLESDDLRIFYPFKNVVFDHDGYVVHSQEFVKQKAERNMKLLEEELEKEPTNLRRLLQCLESSMHLPEKRKEYAYKCMERLMGEPEPTKEWAHMGAVTGKAAVKAAIQDDLPECDEWMAWVCENFTDTAYIQVDLNYAYMGRLVEKKRYAQIIERGLEYLSAYERYRKEGCSESKYLFGPVGNGSAVHELKARAQMCMAYLQEGEMEKAKEILHEPSLADLTGPVLTAWLELHQEFADDEQMAQRIANLIAPLLDKQEHTDEQEKEQYKAVMTHLTLLFAAEKDNAKKPWQLYRKLPGTVGLCARIVDAYDSQSVERMLEQVEDWEEFMPLALNRAMELGAELPEGFHRMSIERINGLINALFKVDKNCIRNIAKYTDPESVTDCYRLSFAYGVLATMWMQEDIPVYAERDLLAEHFAKIGAELLRKWYNPALLEDEVALSRIPALHRFSWYYDCAVQKRDVGDWGGYVETLREALKQFDRMDHFVRYLLKRAVEQEREARIQAASPELLALAEQVKRILAMYHPDDPAVVALKENPAYQQVAFLLEE